MAFGDSDVSQSSQSAQRATTVAGGGYSLTGGGGTTSLDSLVLGRNARADISPDTTSGLASILPLVIGIAVVVVAGLLAWLVFRKT